MATGNIHVDIKFDAQPLIIYLQGLSSFYIPGRRVSVIDAMMWKMYGVKHFSIIEAPKPRPFKWEIIKPTPHIKATWEDK